MSTDTKLLAAQEANKRLREALESLLPKCRCYCGKHATHSIRWSDRESVFNKDCEAEARRWASEDNTGDRTDTPDITPLQNELAITALATPDDTTELDALIADAERYRHLTAHLEDTDGLLNTLFDKFPGRAPTKEQLDAALDESLLAETKEATP